MQGLIFDKVMGALGAEVEYRGLLFKAPKGMVVVDFVCDYKAKEDSEPKDGFVVEYIPFDRNKEEIDVCFVSHVDDVEKAIKKHVKG